MTNLEESLVARIAKLERDINRLKLQESLLPDANGSLTLAGGLNLGTASGAVAGQICCSNDVFPLSQTAFGLYNRVVVHGEAPGQHFESALGVLAWQGAPFATPATASFVDSNLNLYDAANIRAFAAEAVSIANNAAATILARCATFHFAERIGIRIDDGTDNNYVEMYMKSASATGGVGTCDVVTAVRTGGGAETVTVRKAYGSNGEYVTLRMVLSAGGDIYTYININARNYAFIATPLAGRAFTTTRTGIVFKTGGTSGGLAQVDWYRRT